jgi:CheY-like chemotaxis protein
VRYDWSHDPAPPVVWGHSNGDSIQPIHVLLVEDNPADVVLVRLSFEEHNIAHTLHVVSDGGEARTFIRHMGKPDGPPCPDLLLLDINLSKVDGPQLLDEFRARCECIHTPVIVFSSSISNKEQARLAPFRVNRFFKKVPDYEGFIALGSVVREVIGG